LPGLTPIDLNESRGPTDYSGSIPAENLKSLLQGLILTQQMGVTSHGQALSSRRDYSRVDSHKIIGVADAQLISWMPLIGVNERFFNGAAKITGHGVDVITGGF
jgi:hypothetical protein